MQPAQEPSQALTAQYLVLNLSVALAEELEFVVADPDSEPAVKSVAVDMVIALVHTDLAEPAGLVEGHMDQQKVVVGCSPEEAEGAVIVGQVVVSIVVGPVQEHIDLSEAVPKGAGCTEMDRVQWWGVEALVRIVGLLAAVAERTYLS